MSPGSCKQTTKSSNINRRRRDPAIPVQKKMKLHLI
jgi:hypothetical protein